MKRVQGCANSAECGMANQSLKPVRGQRRNNRMEVESETRPFPRRRIHVVHEYKKFESVPFLYRTDQTRDGSVGVSGDSELNGSKTIGHGGYRLERDHRDVAVLNDIDLGAARLVSENIGDAHFSPHIPGHRAGPCSRLSETART
jgi:hypothetical protein